MKNIIYLASLLLLSSGSACADRETGQPSGPYLPSDRPNAGSASTDGETDQPKNLIQRDSTVKGCGDFSLYKKVGDDLVLHIQIDHTQIQFATDYQTFENIATQGFAKVEIMQNCDIKTLWHNVCNDGIISSPCKSTFWKLQSGRLSFKVNKVLSHYKCNAVYYASVILENATFVKENNNETKFLEKVTITNGKVGTCAG